MLPGEILEMINTNINLFKTCKRYYFHKSIFYKEYIADLQDLKYHMEPTEVKHHILRYNTPHWLLDYIHNNTFKIINYNQSVIHFSNLTYLSFDLNFNQPLGKLPNTLTHLVLGNNFNQIVALPDYLIELTIGDKFDKPLKLPMTLKHLTLGIHFNQILQLPDLESLTLGICYDRPLELPPTLKYLTLGAFFNQPLVLPNNLKSLILGEVFNQTLVLPDTLKSVTFGGGFNQIFNFPTKLKYIKLTKYYNKLIDVDSIPKNVEFYIGDNLINY